MSDFEQAFRKHVADVPTLGSDIHYSKSAERLRRLVSEGPLRLTDLRDEPEHFFMAHRIISEFATHVGPGFGIRFTVQFNLFAGTILALGNKEQVKALNTYQKEGRLGCFCLTERLAGVNSGMIVNTTAVWDVGKQMYLLNCPDEGAKKNWISQGLTADSAVVVADLIVKGKSRGPHAFIMDIRKSKGGDLVEGVTVEDMGDKTIGNDLDNGCVNFSNVWLPASALLDRYAGIEKDSYVAREAVSNMEMIGQRLYTGRTVIASSTLVFARTLYKRARQYADNKKCWHPKEDMTLSDVPQLANLYIEADEAFLRVEALADIVEQRLCQTLRASRVPPVDLVEMVAVLKVKAIETSINFCFRLKQELGSYALMGGTGFEKLDYLQCCKFAEGDSRILLQKLARDRLHDFSQTHRGTETESKACAELGKQLVSGGKTAWNTNWKLVYQLADMVVERVTDQAILSSRL